MSVTVNVVGQTAVSVSVAASTSVSVVASGGIGPAGFLTVPGTSTQAFGTFQLQAGDGITVSTANGQFLISSYPSTTVSSLAPVQSVGGRTGAVVLQASDVTAGTFDIGRIPTIGYTALSGVPTAFTPASHTHDSSAIASGTLSIARIPTISYTALSNTPATFNPSAHTHSTTDVVAFTAAASAAAPVQSVQSRTGAVVLTRADLTAAAEVHTHSPADVIGLTASFSQVGHTHDAAALTSGTLDIARIPAIGYTALSGVPSTFAPSAHTHSTTDIVAFTAAASAAAPVQNVAGRTGAISLAAADIAGLASVAASGSYTSLSNVPATFAPSAHTHSTTEVVGLTAAFSQPGHTHSTGDIIGYQGLPAQAGYAGPLVTDGTNAIWTNRYSIVSPVLVQGAGMTLTRDTAAGSITVAFAGGTSGLAVGSLTPLALGTAAAGTSANASREDHVHKLPTVADITAAAASHTHDAAAVTSGTLDIGRIPTIGYTALSGVPMSFTPSTHTHDAAAIASGTIDAARLPANVASLNALTGGITIAGGANVTVSTASSTITIAAGGVGGSGEDSLLRSIFVPPAPTSLTAVAGNASATLSWTAPTGVIAQAPITDYREQYSTDGGTTWTTFSAAASTATTATVTGLTNGQAVRFRVAAVNAVGVGAYTAASSAVTPTAGDLLFSSVSLLLHMDGTGNTFVDSSGTPKTITASGNATQSTAQSQFGGKSAAFDGTGDWIATNTNAGLTFGEGDFTIEFWARPTGNQPSIPRIMGNLSASAFSTGDWVLTQNLGFGFYAYEYESGGSPIVSLGSSLTNDTWAHVAIVRSGSAWSMYHNGSRVSTNTFSGSLDTGTRRLVIGSSGNTAEAWNGYIDELRVTKAARYTGSTITVPTAAFPDS
jgi:titin